MKEFIFNQREIPKKKLRYGFRSSAATGCGWIAVYNALLLMGHEEEPEIIVRNFTWRFPIVNGNFGTFLLSPIFYFKRRGFKVKTRIRRRKFDETAKKNDACILFYYWRNKFKIGAHFVTVQYKDGKFTGYNTYKTSDGPDHYGESLEGYIGQHKFYAPFLIAIKDKRSA